MGWLKKFFNKPDKDDYDFEEKKKDALENTQDIATGVSIVRSVGESLSKAAEKFAKRDYTGNRGIYDKPAVLQSTKKSAFASGIEVKDPYTGNRLSLTKAEAKSLYGADWQKHLAETDHVIPAKRVVDKLQSKPFLTETDTRDITNNDDNLQIVSRSFNNAKRSRMNREFVEDENYLKHKDIDISKRGKSNAIRREEMAEKSIQKQVKATTVKNVVQTYHEAGKLGAQYAGTTALTVSGIRNIVSVMQGEKDIGDAIIDVAKDGGQAAATGYVVGGTSTIITRYLSTSSSDLIKALSEANVPAKVISAVAIAGGTVCKYLNGEITTQECILALGENAVNFAAASYGMAVGQALIPIPVVGAAVGALVGSILTGELYNNLINKLKMEELEHQERLRIIAECKKAVEQEKMFRAQMETYLKGYFKEYQDCFDEALASINFAFQQGDADGIIAGANKITRKLGGQVYYDDVSGFRNFLSDTSIDVL